MHIPDGYIGPVTSLACYAAMAPAWAIAGRRLRTSGRELPLVALGGAFSFVIMMFNLPAPGGTTGHATGAALAGIVLGPAAGLLAVTTALAIQALLFGDGGVLALGANCLDIALLMPLCGFAVYHTLAGSAPGPARRALAAGVAGYLALNLAALATAILLGLQPLLEPGHCPYGLGTAIPAMTIPHLLIFGPVEGVVTAGVVGYLARGRLGAEVGPRAAGAAKPLWVGLGICCLASPLGLLAAGSAWGEWAPEELKGKVGFTPPGLESLSRLWTAFLPDYAIPGMRSEATGTLLSAIVGVAAIAAALFGFGRLLRLRPPGKGKE